MLFFKQKLLVIVIIIIIVVDFSIGVDLSANQDDDDLTDRETFQLEFDKNAELWRLRTADNKYWSLEAASGIQGVGNDRYSSFPYTFMDGCMDVWMHGRKDGRMCVCACVCFDSVY